LTDDDFACGGDTGVFAHGDNVLKPRLRAAPGARPTQVLLLVVCVAYVRWPGKARPVKIVWLI